MRNPRSIAVILAGLMLVVTLLVGSCAAPTEETAIVLKYASSQGPDHPMSVADQHWMEKIKEETNGRVDFEPYWSETLVSRKETLEGVITGVTDIGYLSRGWGTPGHELLSAIMEFSYEVKNLETDYRIYTGVLQKYPEMEAPFSNVKILARTAVPPYQVVMTEKPVRTIDDFKGLQLKAVSYCSAQVKTLGASPQGIGMGDTYISLEKGIIDGGLCTYETLKSFKLADIVKYVTFVNVGTGHHPGRAMNWDSWNSLPADIQKVFENNIEFWSKEVDKEMTAYDQQGYDYGKEMGVEFIELSPADLQKVYDAWEERALSVAAELDAKGLPGTGIYDEVRSLTEKYAK